MYPIITKITTADQFHALRVAMATDNHLPFYPSHNISKEGEIIGCLSVLSVPVLHLWMHSTKANKHQSHFALQIGENLARAAGAANAVVIIKNSSPYVPFLRPLGYAQSMTDTTIYDKQL